MTQQDKESKTAQKSPQESQNDLSKSSFGTKEQGRVSFSDLPWEFKLGRLLSMALYAVFSAGFVIALFASLFHAVNLPPKAWERLESGKVVKIKASHLKDCVKRLRLLDRDLEEQSRELWFRMRHGNRYSRYLVLWKDFSKNWKRRMLKLRRQCNLQERTVIGRSFQRTVRGLSQLQARQEKAFYQFYKDAEGLFREVREGFHSLKEELR